MAISSKVLLRLLELDGNGCLRVARIPQRNVTQPEWSRPADAAGIRHGAWTGDEHETFLEAVETHPLGPWGVIAAVVGTRTARQTMAHAQKYAMKIARHRQGLRRGRSRLSREGMVERAIRQDADVLANAVANAVAAAASAAVGVADAASAPAAPTFDADNAGGNSEWLDIETMDVDEDCWLRDFDLEYLLGVRFDS